MAKKDKATRLPKKVGGVKLPKQLRKSADVVADIAQSPVAREVVSAALVAGAAALAKRKAKDAGRPASEAKGNELDALVTQGKEVGNMIAQGVSAFLGALLKPAEKASAAAAAPARQGAAKPATPRRAASKSTAGKSPSKPASPRSAATKPATAKRAAAKPKTARAPRRTTPKPKA